MTRPNCRWFDLVRPLLAAVLVLVALALPAVGGTGPNTPLSPETLRQLPAADDGRRILLQNSMLSESFISPRECPTCSGDGILDHTDISYHVAAFDTIRVEVFVQRSADSLRIGDIERIKRKPPGSNQFIPHFDGILEGTTPFVMPDGTYDVIIRAYDDTNRVEADTLSLVIDRLPPVLTSATVRGGITTYRNNETIVIDLVADGPNYDFLTNFGTIDSNPAGGTDIIDRGDGTYEIRHTISAENTLADAANLVVPIVVDDRAGNRTRYNALRFCLSNHPPRLVSIVTPDNPDGSYRNGDLIVVESTWESPDTLLSVTIDFSPLDSGYDTTMLTSARLAGNVYRWTYLMSETNTFPDGDYLIPIVARDRGCGMSGLTTVRLRIDTEAGIKPVLDAPPGAVRTPSLAISGMAPGSAEVDIRRNQTTVITVPVMADGRFEATITLLPGTNSLVAVGRDNAGNQSEASAAASVIYLTAMFVEISKPFRPGGRIQVGTERSASNLRIELWTLGGDLARVLADGSPRDVYALTWDGTDGAGNRLNSGPLIAVITLEFPDGRIHTEKLAMILAPAAGR
ncbi:MAG: hypothetical protein SGI90_15550 [Candidatus Eisenbacteria bacterium]|nr:hypothetical protein [Candidatus Eisenbacteria bacterium]